MMALAEERFGFVLRGLHLAAALGLHHDHVHGIRIGLLDADHFALGRGDGQQNDVVLILPVGRLALGRQHAHHGERNLLDTNRLANGVGIAEQIFTTVFPSKATFVAPITSCWVNAAPSATERSRTIKIVGSRAEDDRRPIVVFDIRLALPPRTVGVATAMSGTLRH